MKIRSIDATGDWIFGRGKSDYKSSFDAVAQLIQTRLNSFLGDCFFASTEGLDWFNLLGSKNLLGLKLSVASVILNTPNVISLIEISSYLDNNRRVTIQYSVNTVYGKTSGTVIQGA